MQKSYRKNIRRDFRSNLNRFLSLFGIVALGVMMLTGLVSFAPSMRTAGQKYYVQQNVFDLRVLSTLGLSESDLSAIAATEGVSAVMPVKYLDTEGRWSSSTDGAVLRVQQLPADPAADTEANMNRLTLLEGRMPETANECVVQVLGHADPVPLGTVVTLPEDTEDIRRIYHGGPGTGPSIFFCQSRDQHRRRRHPGCSCVRAGRRIDRRLLYRLLSQSSRCRTV